MSDNGSAGQVLVIDDEADVVRAVRALLERAGYEVLAAADGRAGLRTLHACQPDLVLLDVSMPELDGWQTLERIRDLSDVPVLMLTALQLELEKVRGLRAGADDYVTKPFGNQELLARVDALLRRAGGEATPELLEDPRLKVDLGQRLVWVGDREVRLTPREFALLAALVRQPNRLLSHEDLLEAAWESREVSRDQVRLYVKYLRRKLREAGAGEELIETVRGFGYRYRPAPPG